VFCFHFRKVLERKLLENFTPVSEVAYVSQFASLRDFLKEGLQAPLFWHWKRAVGFDKDNGRLSTPASAAPATAHPIAAA
jgi:hypothetical protein